MIYRNRLTAPWLPFCGLVGLTALAGCASTESDSAASAKARVEGAPVTAAVNGSPVALPATCLDNAKILLVNGSGQTAQSFQNEFTQIQSYLAELNLSATLLQEPTTGLTPANLQGFNLVIYDDAGYAWQHQNSIATLQGAVNAGTPVFLFGDDISWGPLAGQPPSRPTGLPQLTRLTNAYEQNLPFWNGQTDGPQLVSVTGVTHPVLQTAACSVTNFTYQRDIDRTTIAPATAGETILATARGGQRSIVAYEAPSGARTLTADVALVSAEEPVSDAAGLASLKCLFQNAVRWLACPPPSSPDGDKDGVPDASDACPDVAGVASSDPAKTGCPVPPADRDGDGVPDTSDACPDVAGVASADPAKNGCPAATTPTVPAGPALSPGEFVCPPNPQNATVCRTFAVTDPFTYQMLRGKFPNKPAQLPAVCEGGPINDVLPFNAGNREDWNPIPAYQSADRFCKDHAYLNAPNSGPGHLGENPSSFCFGAVGYGSGQMTEYAYIMCGK